MIKFYKEPWLVRMCRKVVDKHDAKNKAEGLIFQAKIKEDAKIQMEQFLKQKDDDFIKQLYDQDAAFMVPLNPTVNYRKVEFKDFNKPSKG